MSLHQNKLDKGCTSAVFDARIPEHWGVWKMELKKKKNTCQALVQYLLRTTKMPSSGRTRLLHDIRRNKNEREREKKMSPHLDSAVQRNIRKTCNRPKYTANKNLHIHKYTQFILYHPWGTQECTEMCSLGYQAPFKRCSSVTQSH